MLPETRWRWKPGAVSSRSGKPLCLILAADMQALSNRATAPGGPAQDPLRLNCSGCTGCISVESALKADLCGDLSVEQRRTLVVLVETLSRFKLLEALTPREIRSIALPSRVAEYESGAVVIREGERVKSLYIIESGTVDVLSGNDELVVTGTLGAGELFGELNPLTGTTCSATVRVREHSPLLSLDGKLLVSMIVRLPSLQDYLLRPLTDRLNESNALREAELSNGLRGSLGELQVLNMSRKSGRLNVTTPRGSAIIVIVQGELIDLSYLRYTQVDALYELLSESQGSFAFTPEPVAEHAGRAPVGDLMSLLMAGFVRLDEEKRVAG